MNRARGLCLAISSSLVLAVQRLPAADACNLLLGFPCQYLDSVYIGGVQYFSEVILSSCRQHTVLTVSSTPNSYFSRPRQTAMPQHRDLGFALLSKARFITLEQAVGESLFLKLALASPWPIDRAPRLALGSFLARGCEAGITLDYYGTGSAVQSVVIEHNLRT